MTEAYAEHAIFVPFQGGRLATVLTLPATDPRGLVLLLQGLNASRSHKNRLWTDTARCLAGKGLAALRMDYPQLGDSTGTLSPLMETPPVDEAIAVARVGLRATGIDRLGVAGNCFGARTGFSLANRMNECISVATILHNNAKPVARHMGAAGSVKRTAHRLPRLVKMARKVLPGTHLPTKIGFLPEVEAVLRTRGGYFLFLGDPKVTARFEQKVKAFASSGTVEGDARVEVRSIDTTLGLRAPAPIRQVIVDSVTDWMDASFPGGSTSPEVRSALHAS